MIHTKSHDHNIQNNENIGVWTFSVSSNNAVAIQSLASSAFIRLDTSTTVQCFTQDSWFVTSGPTSGVCFFNIKHGSYLSVNPSNSAELIASNDCNSDSEFTLTSIEVAPYLSGMHTVLGVTNSGSYLF